MISCIRFIAEVLNSLAIVPVRTVGSLDAVNDQVGAQGLRPRELLPELVVDTFPSTAAADSRSPSPSSEMPPKKRAGGSARVQARKPRNETQTSVTAILPVEKKVCSLVFAQLSLSLYL